VFTFGFETRIKTFFPLINRLINEALLVADHICIRCWFSWSASLARFWWTYSCLQTLYYVAFTQPGMNESEWCILLWCRVAQTVAARHLSSCWRSFQCTTRRQENWAAPTQDSGLHTRRVASQQTRPQSCRLGQNEMDRLRRWGMCLSETQRHVKHRRWDVFF